VNAEQTVQVITDHDQVVATLYLPAPVVNTAPTDITITNANVAENLPAGTVVGTVAAVDAQGGVMVYALLDNANGLLAIDAATGSSPPRRRWTMKPSPASMSPFRRRTAAASPIPR
jgi:hypothetical protein